MRRIWKYELDTTGEQTIKVPILFNKDVKVKFIDQILKLDIQNDKLCLWCLVDLGGGDNDYSRRDEDRKIIIIGTGNPMPYYLTKEDYIGTYQLHGGEFVGHVFVR